MSLLTIQNLRHILNEAVDDLEGLSRGGPSLILRESVQPLQDRLNILLTENLFGEFDCAVLSKTIRP